MKLKYAKSKIGRIEFKYTERMSDRGDGDLWNQDLVEAYLNGQKVGYLKMDYIKDATFWQILPTKEKYGEYFGHMGHTFPSTKTLERDYKAFYYHWVDSPLVDFIKVYPNYERKGIGYALYIAGAKWMEEKKMCLHASTIQADNAAAAWEKLKRIGLPVKTYKNPGGEERKCLDYRNRK